MYFEVKTFSDDPHFSWVISKNPASVFERDLSNVTGARVVRARFDGYGWYCGQVHNDPLQHMIIQKQRNDARYLDASLHAVCPANLAGFATVFRSVLSGKNPSPGVLSDAEFLAPKTHYAELGPFPMGRHRAVVAFADVGVTATVNDECTKEAFTLTLQSVTPVSTTEFLQKLYVVSYYLTCRGSQELTGDQTDKFVRLCAGWLDPLPCRYRIVRELCSFRDGKINAYEKKLRESSSTKTEPSLADITEALEYGAQYGVVVDEATVLAIEEETYGNTAPEGAPSLEREPSLHERRHELVKETVLMDFARRTVGTLEGAGRPLDPHPGSVFRIVDYGCAGGKLSSILATALGASTRVLGVDARITDRSRQRLRRDGVADRVSLTSGNLLYPDLGAEWYEPDALILSEVIEHFDTRDRKRLLEVVASALCPKLIVLTTPNVEYNATLELAPGQYRHWDHRVEYDLATFGTEVMDRLRSLGYEPELVELVPGAAIQPSFVVKAVRCDGVPRHRGITRHVYSSSWLYSRFHLDATDYSVSDREIRAGAVAPSFVANANDIFYLGPTMAAVDHDTREPEFLEHPLAAFEYYRSRGVDRLVAQRKYMGSRAYVAVVREPEMAESFGLSAPCVVNSRSGARFFDRDDPALAEIYAALQPRMTTDLLLLDCEILPWTLKAEGLIRKEFTVPGEVALLDRRRSGVRLENAATFCQVLEGFATPAPTEVRPFHVLATANLSEKGRAKDVVVGLYQPQQWHMLQIEKLSSEHGLIRRCDYHWVNPYSHENRAQSISLWESYCASGGEGFVYKPADGVVVRGLDGYYKQPAVKVRGRDYLRLIYGIDYLEKEFFEKLKHRSTKRKRVMAVQQQELGERMLLAFLRGNNEARTRYAAAFMGVEDVNYGSIDRTL